MLTSLNADEVFTRVKEYLISREIKEEQISVIDKEWKLEFEILKTINLKQNDEDEDEEQKQEDDDADDVSLTERSKFVMEVVQNEEEKRYLTFQKRSGSFMVARDIWTGIQENVKLQE